MCLGGYRDALTFRPGEPISFDPDAFVVSRGSGMRELLSDVMTLQSFEQFRSDRLAMLNSGEGFQDDFEIEIQMHGDRWGSQQRYKDWLTNMKVRREDADGWKHYALNFTQ